MKKKRYLITVKIYSGSIMYFLTENQIYNKVNYRGNDIRFGDGNIEVTKCDPTSFDFAKNDPIKLMLLFKNVESIEQV